MTSYKEKLNHIDTFLFDIDGVFTDGSVYVGDNEFVRKFNSKDSYAVQLAGKLGYKIFIITGSTSESVKNTMLHLGCTAVVLGAKNKVNSFQALKEQYNLDEKTCLYMGDDMPDLGLLKLVYLPTCPQDAAVDVKEICDYQSPYLGGLGCVRDIVEQTLRVQGKWDKNGNHEW
ncbi:MAG TPA: HAD hydrolase family protein [Crocinitomicaceae bacterium]|nr:HAD hydrolase family protein [Crocinitomicaceae bacterium]